MVCFYPSKNEFLVFFYGEKTLYLLTKILWWVNPLWYVCACIALLYRHVLWKCWCAFAQEGLAEDRYFQKVCFWDVWSVVGLSNACLFLFTSGRELQWPDEILRAVEKSQDFTRPVEPTPANMQRVTITCDLWQFPDQISYRRERERLGKATGQQDFNRREKYKHGAVLILLQSSRSWNHFYTCALKCAVLIWILTFFLIFKLWNGALIF